jgi:hypothetical protein
MKDPLPVVAIVISFVAVFFSGLQWYEARNQLLLSMRPSVNFMTNSDDDEFPVGISVDNAGPGPAKIKSVTYFIDKKPFSDVDKALQSINRGSFEDIHSVDLDEGDTLAVGSKEWLVYYNKPQQKQHPAEVDDFLELLETHLAVQIEFCPVLSGECGKKCSMKDMCDKQPNK